MGADGHRAGERGGGVGWLACDVDVDVDGLWCGWLGLGWLGWWVGESVCGVDGEGADWAAPRISDM